LKAALAAIAVLARATTLPAAAAATAEAGPTLGHRLLLLLLLLLPLLLLLLLWRTGTVVALVLELSDEGSISRGGGWAKADDEGDVSLRRSGRSPNGLKSAANARGSSMAT